MVIFCPLCLKEGSRVTIGIIPSQTGAVCPECLRRYTVLTRRLQEVHSKKIDKDLYKYLFYSREPEGGERVRSAVASSHVGILPGHQVTFVWRGRTLVGLADQERSTWHSLSVEPPLYPAWHSFLRFIRWPVLLLLLLQGGKLLADWPQVAENHTLQLVIALASLTALVLAPVALWAARTGGPEAKYLPDYDGEWKDG